MIKCQLCDYEDTNKAKLAKHILYQHKLTKPQYLIQVKYNNIPPTCKCGCGELMKYNAVLGDFPTYIKKHLHVLQKGKTQEEIFGDMNSIKRVSAISKTRKSKFLSGEYNHVKNAIKEARKDPNLSKKISKGAKGIAKPKPKGFGIGRVHSEKTRKKMSDTATERILKTGKVKRSKLEYKFEGILELSEIKYIHSYFIKEINKIFDFYLPDYNILIEVDGDFYHCNPDTKYATPSCKTQERNIKNDKIKTEWALNNGYKLLRFWETDINNNIKQVKKILLENLK